MTHQCSKCGATERCCYNEQMIQQLVSRQLCFSCNFFWRYLNDPVKEPGWHHHSTAVVVDGRIWTDGGRIENPDPRGWGVGCAGAKFRIRMLDGSREWESNNMWSGGEIPEIWRAEIPDTAAFVRATQSGFMPAAPTPEAS